jgi:methylated-DNA-protein-cysteine methyltransferase-like protein
VDREEYVEAVLTAVESIPIGRVATYGDIAAYVGQGGPRQVGAIMREYGGGVPWWRVIRASGVPADEVGDEQIQRLRGDGVRVTDSKVNLRTVRWDPENHQPDDREAGNQEPDDRESENHVPDDRES